MLYGLGVYTAGGTLDLSQMTGEQLANIYKVSLTTLAGHQTGLYLIKTERRLISWKLCSRRQLPW